MHVIDWTILLATLGFIVGYGVWKTRGTRTASRYLRGDNEDRWWAVGLSVMATQASAITFLSTPGQGYLDGLGFVQFYFGLPLAMVVLSATAVPLFHRARVYTAYEYLENRFDAKTRALASAIFLIQRGLGVGFTIYAPALVLSVILGWPDGVTTAIMGGTVVLYTVLGGIKSVTWTDVQQMAVMMLHAHQRFFLLPLFGGRNPSKAKRCTGSPATVSAAIAAQGPGTEMTVIPCSSASLIIRYPGSEIPGVPASDTSAILFPCCNRVMRVAVLKRSLCSK